MSSGWVASVLAEAAALVTDSITLIRALLTLTHVLHSDETTTKIEARRRWLQVACTTTVSLLGLGERSRQGINSLGVLPEFRGVLVHDSLSLYDDYPHARHQLCGTHLDRASTAAVEDHPGQRWPAQIRWVLAELNKQPSRPAMPGLPRSRPNERASTSSRCVGGSRSGCHCIPRAGT